MPDPTFTTPPDAPTRQQPSTFSTRADAFLSWMVTFTGELTTAVSWLSSTASTVSTDATAASDAASATAADVVAASGFADSASDFADNAASAAGATVWVSAAAYTAGDGVSSPVDFQTYRAKLTHSGVATDPSADATNWQRISTTGVYDDLTGKPTLGTAAATDATDYATAAQGATADTAYQSSDLASQAQAEAGTDSATLMTPLRTAEAINALGGTSDYQEFLTSGTWTKPAGVTYVYVEAVGGGGSGSLSTSISRGGGGGAFNQRIFRASDTSDTVVVTVGAGGAGITGSSSSSGIAGGTSTFGSLISAPGSGINGIGGSWTEVELPGYFSGGGGTSGTDPGGDSFKGGAGGGSGSSSGGVSLDGGNGGNGAVNSNAQDGFSPGGGGGGVSNVSGTRTSGAGGNGRVRVWAW